MIFDYQNMFCEDQAATAVDTHASTNHIDMEVVGNAIDPLRVFCQITTAVTTAASGTVQFKLQSATVNTFDTNLISHLDSGALSAATLVKGYKPFGAGTRVPGNLQRYVRVVAIIGTGTLTAGKWTAALVTGQQDNTL